ncbi:DUF5305 domain-containing protein [Halostagnicola kamekurae]|uniref:DUF5305 domain-containing protein n=1 Tax=Halostagnicola kamekurae TaxID=619731 RepID=A0A1I6UAC7_9EURY|nr:DUF5305 domain-containing protein [Halostagnicola kamekurae]SFS98217.1 hypothetical protein SAMN04488556_3668 [Halostagnicola kamekurae]
MTMNTDDLSPRVRAGLTEWFIPVIVLVLILTTLSGIWAYQINVTPAYETDQRTVNQWEETTTYDHSTVITQNTSVWEAGQRLENRPLYYSNVSSGLAGVYSYNYTADSGNLTVTTEISLRIQSQGENDQAVYWETTETLETERTTSMSPQDTHAVEFQVDIEPIRERIVEIENELGASDGSVNVRVLSTSELTGEVDGQRVNHSYESALPLDIGPSTFSVTEVGGIDETHPTTERVRTQVPPSPLQSVGSVVVFATSLVGLIGLFVARNTGALEITDAEREQLEFERDRERFDEWITTGTFPSEREYESTILVDNLTGLIDVAIDTNKRVIEDQQLGVSTVLDEEYSYIYVHPGSPARDWLLNYADETIDEFEQYEF